MRTDRRHTIGDRAKIRDGKVANRPIYVALSVTVEGTRDILGLWAGDGGEGAKFWFSVCTELKNRGVEDVLMAVCDGLTGLPDAINTVWPKTVVQTCVVHLLRNSFKYAGRQHWDAIAKALKPVYTAPTEAAAEQQFLEFAEVWGEKYPAIVRLWTNAWAEFVPFLAFDAEIRKVVCSTNAIESVNARIRRAVRARGHFPNEQAGRIQLINATPPNFGGSHGTSGHPGRGSARVLGRGPGRHGRRGGRVGYRRVDHGRLAVGPAGWRGDAAGLLEFARARDYSQAFLA